MKQNPWFSVLVLPLRGNLFWEGWLLLTFPSCYCLGYCCLVIACCFICFLCILFVKYQTMLVNLTMVSTANIWHNLSIVFFSPSLCSLIWNIKQSWNDFDFEKRWRLMSNCIYLRFQSQFCKSFFCVNGDFDLFSFFCPLKILFFCFFLLCRSITISICNKWMMFSAEGCCWIIRMYVCIMHVWERKSMVGGGARSVRLWFLQWRRK